MFNKSLIITGYKGNVVIIIIFIILYNFSILSLHTGSGCQAIFPARQVPPLLDDHHKHLDVNLLYRNQVHEKYHNANIDSLPHLIMSCSQHPGFPGMHPKRLWAQPVWKEEIVCLDPFSHY